MALSKSMRRNLARMSRKNGPGTLCFRGWRDGAIWIPSYSIQTAADALWIQGYINRPRGFPYR